MQFQAINNFFLPMHHYIILYRWEVFQRCVRSPLNALMRTMRANSWQMCPLLLLNNEILQNAINFYIAINVSKGVPFNNLQLKINAMQSTCKIYCKNIWRHRIFIIFIIYNHQNLIIISLMQYYEIEILSLHGDIKLTALKLQKKKVKLNSLVEIV